MMQRNSRNVLFISLSQFGIAFSFNFVMVFLPFFIHDISPFSSGQTLIWIGLIMGAPSFAAALVSTFWGSLASRISPKILYMRGLLSHAAIILLMGFISSLPVLLVLRMVQGIMGGISTVGLIIVSSSSSKESSSKDMGLFQNAMTFGQLIGPPIGALAATSLSYKGAFISASAFVFLTLVFCFFNVKEVTHEPSEMTAFARHAVNRSTLLGWMLCFAATVQLMFLPSILPDVFRGFQIKESTAVKSAGLLIMLYTATAMAGTFFLCRLAGRLNVQKMIIAIGILGTALQCLLSASPGIITFGITRMLQTAMIAAVMPLVFSSFASDLDERAIGFLNSSRFAGNALGPMIGTFILAFSSPTWIYLSIGGLGLLVLAGYAFYAPNRNS